MNSSHMKIPEGLVLTKASDQVALPECGIGIFQKVSVNLVKLNTVIEAIVGSTGTNRPELQH